MHGVRNAQKLRLWQKLGVGPVWRTGEGATVGGYTSSCDREGGSRNKDSQLDEFGLRWLRERGRGQDDGGRR